MPTEQIALTLSRLEDRHTPASTLPLPAGTLVSGGGPGGPPLVQVFHPDGTFRAQFLAYAEGFRGGVQVAMADVNNDGVKDVITSAGAGGGPHVKVFDGKSVQEVGPPTTPTLVVQPRELFSFYAYDSKFTGGVSVAAADVDADGYADVITGAGAGGGPHVKAFSGKTGSEIRSFFAFDPTFRGGVNVAAGELQEEPFAAPIYREFADILVGSGAGMKATVKGFNGRTGDEFFSINPHGNFTGGVYVAGGDMTGDGFDDVITGAGAGGGPHVTAWDGFVLGHLATILLQEPHQAFRSFYAYNPAFGGGVRVGTVDLNNDAKADIVTAAGPGGGPHLKGFNGADGKEVFSTFKYGLKPGTPEFAAGSSIAGAYQPLRPTNLPLPGPNEPFSRLSDFTRGAENWSAGFTDFSTLSQPDQLQLESGLTPLPGTAGTGTGYLLGGNNLSSDLFMFLKRKFNRGDGIRPNTTYTVDFTVKVASDAPTGGAGPGGAPGESVYLKAGGGITEPTTVTSQPNDIRLNVDKGHGCPSGIRRLGSRVGSNRG